MAYVIGSLANYFIDQVNLKTHLELIKNSYFALTGEVLPLDSNLNLIQAFDYCSYAIATHDISPEPLFNYANRAALDLFKMTSQAMIGLPSKKSASLSNQEERAVLLREVTEHGLIKHYQGKRIASDNSIFQIEDATVWNLINNENIYCGQAVIIFKVS